MPEASPPSSPARWLEDKKVKKCGACLRSFTLTKRKHHCRACGDIFCNSCSKGAMSVDGYKGSVRVCNKCLGGGAIWDRDEYLSSESEEETLTPPLSPRLAAQPQSHLNTISGLLKTSSKVSNSFPSDRFSACCHPHVKDCSVSVVFPSERSFADTLGILKDVSKAADDGSLRSLRKPYAEAAINTTSPVSFGCPVWEVPHNLTQIVVPSDGPCKEGPFIGTKVLNVAGQREDKAALLSTCIAEIASNVVIGRHGRVDTSVKARQLAQFVGYVLRRRGLQGVNVRMRFCSLLNALSITPKEMAYFKNQLTLLSGFNGALRCPSPSPSPDRNTSAPIPMCSSPVHGPHSSSPEQLTISPGIFSSGAGSLMSVDSVSDVPPMDLGTAFFDFPTAMAEMGVDYSYLNFVANWPLSLRLGNQPASKHNATHDMGLKKHLQWLVLDVLEALAAVNVHMDLPICMEDPWRVTLPKVRSAVNTLCEGSTTEKEKVLACNLFMAVNLLAELTGNKGSNFRRRAAELLQLCLLEHILGTIPFFNCKSGIDRTGVCNALWAAVSQLMSSAEPPPLWLVYYLAMNYSLVLKISKGVHGCVKAIPVCQLTESNFVHASMLLPHPAGGSSDAQELILYSNIEELYQLVASKGTLGSAIEELSYSNIATLFFSTGESLVPRLQYSFFVNVLGVAARVSCISTGVHGLKYGDCGKIPGHHNALAAQFLPSYMKTPSQSIKVTGLRRNLAGTDIIVTKEFAVYLVAAADARGT
eukprot:TRINITY_DN1201_c0_g4_i1.p1 TRINITY_DN1201_c0_g4~~TRINITY_DN1201_c0_g4_i1.p1  ORF type:complete len:757 (+),score=138.38 TRINITY_DN1201_c0_g4_i1:130-2400(+)